MKNNKVIMFMRGNELIGYLGDLNKAGIFRVSITAKSAKVFDNEKELEETLERLKKAFPYNRFILDNAS